MTHTHKKNNTQIFLFVRNFIEKHFEFKNKDDKQEVIDGIVEYTQILLDKAEQDNRQSANEIKDEAIEKVRNELATKDFVRAEIAEVRQELAEVKQELKQEIAEVRQELAEVKQELKQDIAEVRQELKQEIAEVRQELKQEIADLKFTIIKWFLGVSVSAVVLAIGANFALIGFLIQSLKG